MKPVRSIKNFSKVLLIFTQLVLGYEEHGFGVCGRGCCWRWPPDNSFSARLWGGVPGSDRRGACRVAGTVWEGCRAEVAP